MDVIVASRSDLRQIVDASVETATAKILSRLQSSPAGPKEWLTNKEARQFLGVSKTTLQRRRDDGTLPFSKLGGNIYYRYADLVAILEQHIVEQ